MLVAGIRLSLSMLPRGELGKGTKAGIRRETGALRPVAVLNCECRDCHTHPDLAKTRTRRANHPQSWSSPSTDCSSPRTPDLCCDFQHRSGDSRMCRTRVFLAARNQAGRSAALALARLALSAGAPDVPAYPPDQKPPPVPAACH